MNVKTCDPASVGSSPVSVPLTSGVMLKAVLTIASFTGAVKVTRKVVVGAMASPTTVEAVILPAVAGLVRNEVSVASPRLRPSRSRAVPATSTL